MIPEIGSTLTLNGIDYIVLKAFRLGDKGPDFQGKPWSNNIAITLKRPRGVKRYEVTRYTSGLYSSVVGGW